MIAGFCYFLAMGVTVPVLPKFIAGPLHGSDLVVGIVVGAFAVSAVLTRPTAGRLGNRLGRRALMIGGAGIAGASIAAYGAAPNVAVLAALRLLTGVGEGMFFTGSATIVADLAPAARRGEALSYFSVSVYLGTGLGPTIGEAVSKGDGSSRAFLVAGGLSLLGMALSLRAPETRTIAEPVDVDAPPVARPGLVNRKALGPGAVLALGLMGFTAFQAYVPLYTRRLGLDGSQFVFLVYAAVVLAVRIFGARIPDRIGPARSGTFATIVVAVGLSTIAITGSVPGLYAGTIVFAVGMSLQYPALMAMAVNRADEHERSSVVGTFTAFFDLAQGAGGLLLGGVAGVAGYRASFGGGAVCALFGLALLRLRVAPSAARRASGVDAEPEAWAPAGFD
jgi:MFS family permease